MKRRVARALLRLGHGLVLHGTMQAAPAMAFHFFLSLLPLLVFVGYVVGKIAEARGVDAVLAPFFEYLPPAAALVLEKELGRLAGARALGPIAAVGFLWIASGGTHGTMNAIETVVGAPPRTWLRKRALALVFVVAALGCISFASLVLVEWATFTESPVAPVEAVEASASDAPSPRRSADASRASSEPRDPRTPIGGAKGKREQGRRERERVGPRASAAVELDAHAGRTAEDHAARGPQDPRGRSRGLVKRGGERVIGLAFTLAVATGGLSVFYWVAVRRTPGVKRRVFPGALLAVVVWMVASWGFGLYVRSLAEYAVFYGSLAAVAVLLVWFWLTSLAILVGAELNSQLEGLRD